MKPNPIPPLHVVMDDAVVARGDFLDVARRVIEAGGPLLVFHLRAPRAPGRRMYELARALLHETMGADGRLVVNDRLDVALAAGDGAQVGARGLHPADARRVLGPDSLLGVSVHSVDEARGARGAGADFVLAGTIWQTESHPGRPGAGTGLIRDIAALGIPTIAIGGVTPARVAEARDAGAAGVAVIRGVWGAPDPAAAVAEYLERWRAEPPAPAVIQVFVNGETRDVPGGLTVAGVLRHLSLDPDLVAVAYHGYVLTREELDAMPVNDGTPLRISGALEG